MQTNTRPSFIMYSKRETQQTLNPKFIPPYLQQTQWAEYTKLKEIIGEVYTSLNKPLRVFDIGIGYSRIPLWLSKVATWNKISKYIGIDISEHCVTQSKRIASNIGIKEKVEVFKFNAVNLYLKYKKFIKHGLYDLIVCTYFTAGDFKPDGIKIETNEDESIVDYDASLLEPNEDFIAVFKGAYNSLRSKGKIVIGSIYRDGDFVRKIQEDFYRNCAMTVITTKKDPFTATKEGFWSERFNSKKIYNYLSWVPQDKIELIPLDDYDFAFMVVITK